MDSQSLSPVVFVFSQFGLQLSSDALLLLQFFLQRLELDVTTATPRRTITVLNALLYAGFVFDR